MATIEIQIPPRAPFVGVVRLALSSLARNLGVDEERVADIKIAVSEVCANAVLAHEEQSLNEPISVRWMDSADAVTVEVGHRGDAARDTDGREADTQGIATRQVMSLALLQSLVDSFESGERDGGGSLTRLTFSR